MVVIHVKRSDGDQFLFETTCTETNDNLIRNLAQVHNMRLRLAHLNACVRDLAQYGPMRPQDKQGIDEVHDRYEGAGAGAGAAAGERGEFYTPDPTGQRSGNGPGPQLAATLVRVCEDAESMLRKDLVDRKIALSMGVLQEKLDNIRGAVIMAYPMGLPEFDPVRLSIEGLDGLDGTPAGMDVIDEATSELWAAGREFVRGQLVSDRVGRNEKTKLVAKLQKPGAGAPAREPVVSEEEQKEMMAFYFKKQEELKRLAEAEDDDFHGSSWADPRSLQRSLRGMGDLKAPGLR